MLFVYLVSYTEVRQVLKLPELLEHFAEHKSKDHRTTIFSFIKIHYIDAPVKDADYKDDMKLPFKTHDCSVASNSITTPPVALKILFENKKLFTEKKSVFSYFESCTDFRATAVFRPPILA